MESGARRTFNRCRALKKTDREMPVAPLIRKDTTPDQTRFLSQLIFPRFPVGDFLPVKGVVVAGIEPADTTG